MTAECQVRTPLIAPQWSVKEAKRTISRAQMLMVFPFFSDEIIRNGR
jgi:hypothetical protein